MHLLRVCLLVALAVFASPAPVLSQDYATLFARFRPTDLTYSDKRYLQAALAFEGHYNGLLDGDWGRRSRDAMSDYSYQTFGDPTQNWHMAYLALSFYWRIEEEGWEMRFFPDLGLSMLWPRRAIVADAPSRLFENHRHTASTLAISFGRHDQTTAQDIHDFTQSAHARGEPYALRRSNLAISTATKRDGTRLYTRSDFRQGWWSTVMLSAARQDVAQLHAVAASLSPGRSAPLEITQGGNLDDVIVQTIALLENSPEGEEPMPDPAPPEQGQTGTGFVVSLEGHVLTNAHVVAGCNHLQVDGKSAALIRMSEEFDLALLQTEMVRDKTVAVFSAQSPRLNSDVTVVGYPYSGLLGGLNVTRGSVSALNGLGGDATRMQITAPVQSGNSGGPILAGDGEVVGVVVSKLDARKVAEVTGDLPQNVNFAIRGEIAKLFLSQSGVEPHLSLDDEALAPEMIAERAQSFVTFIDCR